MSAEERKPEMTLEALRESLPDHAKDLRLNLGAIQRSDVLSEQQLWGAIAATAVASREPALVRAAYSFRTACLDDSSTQSRRRSTVNGRMTLP